MIWNTGQRQDTITEMNGYGHEIIGYSRVLSLRAHLASQYFRYTFSEGMVGHTDGRQRSFLACFSVFERCFGQDNSLQGEP